MHVNNKSIIKTEIGEEQMVGKKRLMLAAGVLASVGAVVALATGVTFGLFSATQTSSGNTLTAGTVTEGTPSVTTCTTSNIVPGDSGDCTISVTYTGSAPANLGLDLSVAGTPGTLVQAYGDGTPAAAAGLYDPLTSNGLVYTITDNVATSYSTSGLSSANSSVTDLLAAKAVGTGTVRTFTIHWQLPSGASNAFQAAATSLTATVHAVQSGNNASSGTLGQVDNSISWS
jgi:predicted ribosomally synthesized peptide with SipW-like signal peptide